MASGLICQCCGIEAPTRKVEFHQNIGMLVMRTRRKVAGNLCKKCVNKHFWKMTTTTLFLAPWGTISLVMAPCFIINNVARYLGSLGMPAVPPGAAAPVLTEAVIAKLQPQRRAMFDRLNLGENIDAVATDVARKSGVTPGQVIKYMVAVAQQSRQAAQQQPPTGGFPVVVPPQQPQGAAVIPLEEEPIEYLDAIEEAPEPTVGIPTTPQQ